MSDDLIELIRLMNEKPIAFNKHYVFLGCGINGAVMLSQLVYWADKSKDPNGWIYKTSKEWTEETGLTRREQDTARKNLRELGFIDEHKHGVPCKTHYKVNQDALYSSLLELAQKRQTDAQISQTECTKAPNLNGGKRQTNTESTSKITPKNTHIINSVKKFNPSEMQLPINVDKQLWLDFIEMRKQIKKKLTERAAKMILKDLEGFGHLANESLTNSIKSSWSSVYKPKIQNYQPQQNNRMQELEQLSKQWELENESNYQPY